MKTQNKTVYKVGDKVIIKNTSYRGEIVADITKSELREPWHLVLLNNKRDGGFFMYSTDTTLGFPADIVAKYAGTGSKFLLMKDNELLPDRYPVKENVVKGEVKMKKDNKNKIIDQIKLVNLGVLSLYKNVKGAISEKESKAEKWGKDYIPLKRNCTKTSLKNQIVVLRYQLMDLSKMLDKDL